MEHTESYLQSAAVIKWNLYLYENGGYRKPVRLHSQNVRLSKNLMIDRKISDEE